jgi:hypothetical protein
MIPILMPFTGTIIETFKTIQKNERKLLFMKVSHIITLSILDRMEEQLGESIFKELVLQDVKSIIDQTSKVLLLNKDNYNFYENLHTQSEMIEEFRDSNLSLSLSIEEAAHELSRTLDAINGTYVQIKATARFLMTYTKNSGETFAPRYIYELSSKFDLEPTFSTNIPTNRTAINIDRIILNEIMTSESQERSEMSTQIKRQRQTANSRIHAFLHQRESQVFKQQKKGKGKELTDDEAISLSEDLNHLTIRNDESELPARRHSPGLSIEWNEIITTQVNKFNIYKPQLLTREIEKIRNTYDTLFERQEIRQISSYERDNKYSNADMSKYSLT